MLQWKLSFCNKANKDDAQEHPVVYESQDHHKEIRTRVYYLKTLIISPFTHPIVKTYQNNNLCQKYTTAATTDGNGKGHLLDDNTH